MLRSTLLARSTRLFSTTPRILSSSSSSSASSPNQTPGEKHLHDLLTTHLKPSSLKITDTSGGCGAMYAIEIASDQFKGLSVLKQHRLVVGVIDKVVKSAHGGELLYHFG
ncbi:hypothetical protein HDV05_005392 [Chytridiales sp. JEL 0842]|nr:hypothetical protein HDV05_005392 [Chytridiales sp. JEL 0842]